MTIRHVVGCMIGTSLDGLDVALVTVEGHGLTLTARFERALTFPLGPLAEPMQALADQRPQTAREIATLARDLANLHNGAISELVADQRIDLIAVHGQTVYHAPPLNWQLFNPALVVRRFRVPVVYDLRASDIAAGGQGAPISSVVDYVFFHDTSERRAIVNLGGFCNFTWLPAYDFDGPRGGEFMQMRGGDICVCNHLLNAAAQRCCGIPFDEEGARGQRGTVQPNLSNMLVTALRRQGASGRSLGTGDELYSWLESYQAACSPEDLLRTICEAIATCIRERVGYADRVIISGGGARNLALRTALADRYPRVTVSDELGLPLSAREATAVAVLGALTEDNVQITLPQVTGSDSPCRAGLWAFP